MSSVSKPVGSTEKPPSNLYDSDSDMSDTERLILERRRLNTEYMEQIEKERQEMQKVQDERKDVPEKKRPQATSTIKDKSDVEMKDAMGKSLEELEAERDALLQQVRNPDPPGVAAKSESAKVPTKAKSYEKTAGADVESRKANKDAHMDVDVEALTGERSPCQVSVTKSVCWLGLSYVFVLFSGRL